MVAADRDRGGGPPLVRVAVGLALALVLALAGWIAIFGTPDGGEPVFVADIPPEPEIAVEPDGLPIRATVPPEHAIPGEDMLPDGDGDAVRIIDPSAGMTRAEEEIELARAPVASLVEPSEFGLLPRIGEGGRTPAEVYARPARQLADGPGAPVRAALVVTGLGISASGTSDAIARLPGDVSLAFAPYGTELQSWVDRARSDGHEVFLQVPMEPFDYPDNDPGPHTLLTSLEAGDNLDRLHWLLGRFAGYVGITNYMGARLTSDAEALRPIMREIAARGLSYLDDGASSRSQAPELALSLATPAATADVAIAADEPREAVLEALSRLEEIAKEHGQALAVATALPVTIDAISEWIAGLEGRGVVLIPASALINDRTS